MYLNYVKRPTFRVEFLWRAVFKKGILVKGPLYGPKFRLNRPLVYAIALCIKLRVFKEWEMRSRYPKKFWKKWNNRSIF